MKTRKTNPISEIRNPNETRNPKPERTRQTGDSNFGLWIAFGFRISIFGFLAVLSTLCPSTFAQGTAFTYQGVLADQNGLVSGTNDLTFTLFTTPSGAITVGTSNVLNDLVTTNGLFTVTLDYGTGIFDGNARWLQIAVRPGVSTGPYTNVNPRQRITPTPYAIFAGNSSNLSATLPSGALSGVYSNALTLTNANNNFRGKFTGNGSGLTNVDAATLSGLPPSAFWQIGGNVISPGDSLGSANNQ